MKKTSFILFLIIILNIILSTGVFADTVYEEAETSYITKGVILNSIKRLTSDGWYNINYVTVDLEEEGVGLKILSNGTKTRNTVLGFAKAENDVVAAINADFFTAYSSGAAPEGMMIKDGTLITTPSTDPSYTTFTLNEDLTAAISNFTFDIMVTSKRTNDSSKILFYNKIADPMYLKIYDSGFGKTSPGSMEDGYEVVVEDGIVTGIYSNKEGVEIPENGYVLHNSLRHSLFLSENFMPGDEVELSLSLSPDIENIKEAVGGGTVLLANGEVTPFSLSNSTQPMTAIGIDETGKKLVLFTVDGRQTYSKGMNFTQIANFLKELGCYSAMSFDGGGSTTLVASADGEELKAINSQSSYRSVINAIGITAKKEKGDFLGMKISLSQNAVFTGMPVEVYIHKAYDEYGNSFDLSGKKIIYSADKKGEFKDNVFYPEEEGQVEISVTVDGFTATKALTVYEEPTEITASASSFEISDSPQKVSFYLKNSEGYSAYISSEDLDFSFEDAKGYVKKDVLTLTKLKDGILTASYKDLSLKLPIGEAKIEAEEKPDKFQRTTEEEGFVFSVFGVNDNGNTLYTNYVTGKRNIIANTCDLSAFKVIPDTVTSPAIKVSNYGREDTDHSLFIKLDNSKGSITSTKAEQWSWLLNVFKKGVKQKNVFITMPLDISKHTDQKELEILTNLLKENLPDKNIFIITFGNDNTYTVKNGIRYITVCDIPAFSYKNPMEVLSKLKYAKFTIVNEEVYFEFASVI